MDKQKQGQPLGITGRVLNVTLAVILLVTAVALGYVIVTPRAHTPFTDFYILAADGTASNFPSEVKVGESKQVIAGIVNHENQPVNYTVRVNIGGQVTDTIENISLTADQKWEQKVSFTPQAPALQEKVEVQLFREGSADPYETVYCFVSVVPASQTSE